MPDLPAWAVEAIKEVARQIPAAVLVAGVAYYAYQQLVAQFDGRAGDLRAAHAELVSRLQAAWDARFLDKDAELQRALNELDRVRNELKALRRSRGES